MRTISILLLAALSAIAAPPPQAAVKPVVQVEPGDYTLHWGGTLYRMGLIKDGYYGCREATADVTWEGSWTWDKKTRILIVSERIVGSRTYSTWMVPLDSKLSGMGGFLPHTDLAIRLVKE